MNPRSMTVILFQGDDAARADDLEAKADALAPVPGAPVRQSGAVQSEELKAALAAYDEFVGVEADARALKVTLEAVGRKKWATLLTQYPAREGEEFDDQAGFDVDAGGETLVTWSVVAITDAGKKVQTQKVPATLDALSDGQFFQLLSAAVKLNIDASPAPKADLSSRVTTLYDAMSGSRNASA